MRAVARREAFVFSALKPVERIVQRITVVQDRLQRIEGQQARSDTILFRFFILFVHAPCLPDCRRRRKPRKKGTFNFQQDLYIIASRYYLWNYNHARTHRANRT